MLQKILSIMWGNYFKSVAFSLLILLSISTSAQELKCTVTIDAQQVQTQETQVFDEMKIAFEQFINNQKWTEDEYADNEKIECDIVIQLSQGNVQAGQYQGTAQIQASRPVYNSDYKTTTFFFFDKFVSFVYRPGANIFFNENSYTNNLTALFSFYAYMILGHDYDTFSSLGGTPYYQKALNIINTVPDPDNVSDGWNSQKGPNNRWGLSDQTNSPQIEKLRIALYNYHRLALDNFATKTKDSQQEAKKLVFELLNTKQTVPISVFIENIFKAKESEFISIFKELPNPEEKSEIYQALRTADPVNSENYSTIVRSR